MKGSMMKALRRPLSSFAMVLTASMISCGSDGGGMSMPGRIECDATPDCQLGPVISRVPGADPRTALCHTGERECRYRVRNNLSFPCIKGEIRDCEDGGVVGITRCVGDSTGTSWGGCGPL
jgi:hypothetical protein